MGIAEIVTATLAVMGGITGGSAIMGAVMGSHRKIGSVRGFFWGLMFPVPCRTTTLLELRREGSPKREGYVISKKLHHVIPVQFHEGVDPEAAPVAPHQVEVREGPVEGRFAL